MPVPGVPGHRGRRPASHRTRAVAPPHQLRRIGLEFSENTRDRTLEDRSEADGPDVSKIVALLLDLDI